MTMRYFDLRPPAGYVRHSDAEVLAAIERLISRGYPPTIREIGAECGISSTSVVTYWLDHLEDVGKIVRGPRIARGIRLVNPAPACGCDHERTALLEEVARAASACQAWWDTQRGESLEDLDVFVHSGAQGSRHVLTLARLDLARALAALDAAGPKGGGDAS